MKKNSLAKSKSVIGWREWVSLPELGIPRLKAKIDTGARTSALHAFNVETYHHHGQLMVSFGIHPHQGRNDDAILCSAKVHDKRIVTNSGGQRERRYVIISRLRIGYFDWPIEFTLTNRDTMKFRMLLGRTGLGDKFLVEPDASYLFGKPGRHHP
ncbi:MAG: ATP-dependent zinc protease [Gammaproteobacteria bacterium]|nr:ATP-dependent zinc protease [Gammaproteobacteria bacterium]